MLKKPFVLERIDAAWTVWLYVIDGIPDDRCSEPVADDWSIKDLLGHTALWDEQAAAEAALRPTGSAAREIDFQAINDIAHAALSAPRLKRSDSGCWMAMRS